MEGRQQRENERNVRSEQFLQENASDFTNNQVATAKIADLKVKNARVAETAQKQMAGDTSVSQDYLNYHDVFDDLLDEMRSVRDFAESISRDVAGLEKKFRLPRSGGKPAILTAAEVFARDAEEYKQTFLDYGMDADFIEHLRDKAAAAQTALNRVETSTGERVGATGTLEIEVKAASDIVLSLDPIVRRIYRDDPIKLAAWDYASRLERHTPVPRQSKKPKV